MILTKRINKLSLRNGHNRGLNETTIVLNGDSHAKLNKETRLMGRRRCDRHKKRFFLSATIFYDKYSHQAVDVVLLALAKPKEIIIIL